MSHDCVFCKLIDGQIPSRAVYEDEGHVGFLSIRPIREGHALVIPRVHVEDVLAADDAAVAAAFVSAKRLAERLKRIYGTRRVALLVSGLEIAHLHIHVIPADTEADLDFTRATETSPEVLDAVAEKIRAAGV